MITALKGWAAYGLFRIVIASWNTQAMTAYSSSPITASINSTGITAVKIA